MRIPPVFGPLPVDPPEAPLPTSSEGEPALPTDPGEPADGLVTLLPCLLEPHAKLNAKAEMQSRNAVVFMGSLSWGGTSRD